MKKYAGYMHLKKRTKEYWCKMFGHQPRGPLSGLETIYKCERCSKIIYFDRDRGWILVQDRK